MARRQWIEDVTPVSAANMNGLEDDVEKALAFKLRVGSVKSGPVAGAEFGERVGNEQLLNLTLPTDTEFGWIYAGFGNNQAAYEKLGIHYSPDGKYVVAGVNNPVYAPVGGVRDPSIYRHTNGRFYVAYTINNGIDKQLGLAVSDDLVNWSLVTKITVSAATNMSRAWAPQVVRDTNGDVYLFFTNVDQVTPKHSTWRVKATDLANLTTWSAPAAVVWAPAPAAQPGQYPLDAAPIFANGKWTIFFSGEGGQIWRASAATLTGTWTVDKTGDWASWMTRAIDGPNTKYEAPEILEARPGVYRLYMDRYVGTSAADYVFRGYVWSESTDFETWTAPVAVQLSPGFPGGQTARHGAWVKLASAMEREKAISATLGGLPPIRAAAFSGTGTKAVGASPVDVTLGLDAAGSSRADDFVETAGASQIRVKVDGLYSIDFVLSTSNGSGLGAGWIALKSPDQSVNYMTNDYPAGPPAWGIAVSNVYLRAGTVIKAFGSPGAAFATAGVLRMQLRIAKVQ